MSQSNEPTHLELSDGEPAESSDARSPLQVHTHLCISHDVPCPGLGLGTWLAGTHTWTRKTCHQRHRRAWAESWSSAGCTEDHDHLLETRMGKKRKDKEVTFAGKVEESP